MEKYEAMCGKKFCVTVLTSLALIAFILIFRLSPHFDQYANIAWCSDCSVQSWLAATSGWIGFFAAVLALTFTWSQLSQQRKQTDFLLGDATPTMDITPDVDDPQNLVVRIVNWNRRGILVRQPEMNIGEAMAVMEVKCDDQIVKLARTRWPYPLKGWVNRGGGPPHVLQFKIIVDDGGGLVSDWPENTRVDVEIQLLDQRHRTKTLTAVLQGAD